MSKRPSSGKQNGLSCKKKKKKKKNLGWVRWYFGKNVSYCYHLFRILVWSVSDETSYFIETKFLFKDGSLLWGNKVWWAVWVILSHFWTKLSRGLHGIKRALKKKKKKGGGGGGGNKRNAFQDKTKSKTRKWNVPHFVSKTTCFVAVAFWFAIAVLFSFRVFLWWTTRPRGIGYTCLRCLWMWKYSDTHSSFNICRKWSKVHKKCLSALFRLQPKPVLDKCEGEKRNVGAIVFAEQ